MVSRGRALARSSRIFAHLHAVQIFSRPFALALSFLEKDHGRTLEADYALVETDRRDRPHCDVRPERPLCRRSRHDHVLESLRGILQQAGTVRCRRESNPRTADPRGTLFLSLLCRCHVAESHEAR